MSDTNRVSIGIIKEVTPNVTPPNPQFDLLRITGAPSLAYTPISVITNEIRADRNLTDSILVGAEAGGDTNHELSFGALDGILEGFMFNAWTKRNARAGTDITNITANVITVNAGAAFAVKIGRAHV